MKLVKTNIILFPYMRTSIVELVNYWAILGYRLANTDGNNICLAYEVYE
jgi:hypothetical protein